MKSAIVCHGDCDGVISAFLYIKHYLRDSYPRNVEMIFTQPWRAHLDMRKLPEGVNELIMLDIALNHDVINRLAAMVSPTTRITVIDHHASSGDFINDLMRMGVKIVWDKAPSTPRLMLEKLKPVINPYEEFLIGVADVCEGAEAQSEKASRVADLIKLSIARDPGDLQYLNHLIKLMLRGQDVSLSDEVIQRANVAKWLLNKLIKLMESRAVLINDCLVATLANFESRIFAGLLGVATTELSKVMKSDVILIREEEGKVVVTVRSIKKRALSICKAITKSLGGRYGGHVEAASATLSRLPLEEVQLRVIEVVKNAGRHNPG